MGRASRQISLPFIRIDRKGARPLYEQLYEGMRLAILEGRLRPNDRLPATRLIAEELGVSRNIVVMAFEQLGMEGYIQGRSGSGSFVSAEIPEDMERVVRRSLGYGGEMMGQGDGGGMEKVNTEGRGIGEYMARGLGRGAGKDGEGVGDGENKERLAGAEGLGDGANKERLEGEKGVGDRVNKERLPGEEGVGDGANKERLIGEEGVVDGKPGAGRRLGGSFVDTLNRVVLPRNTIREDILPFQTGQPAFDAFPFAIWSKLAARVYRYLDFQHLGYEDAAGYYPLREAIADHLRVNRSVVCDADRILIVNGTQQALALCAQLLLQPGDRFWIDDPGYTNARAVFTLFGGEPCPIPVTGEGMDIDYAFRHYPDARLAYLTPSHQDPVGGTLTLSQRLKLLAWSRDHRLWLVEDDYDSELRYRGKPIPSLQGLDTNGNVIYVGTFSKVLFPALRVAYMVLPDQEVFRAFKSLKALNDRQSALTDQLILTDFIKEGYFHRHLRKMRTIYNQRLQCLLGELTTHLSHQLSFTDPAAGMHLAAFFKQPVDEDRLLQAAAARKLVLPCLREYTVGNYERPGILLGYAAFPEQKIRQAVQTLADCFKEIS